MVDLVAKKSKTIEALLKDYAKVKHNPSNMLRVVYDYIDEIHDGQVDIVDPTNPFVALLEAACVQSVLAVNENMAGLRTQYASLAQTEEDLYRHMSDEDYPSRFATPSTGTFTIAVSVNDLMTRLIHDPVEDCYKATIARDTEIRVDDLVFTLFYPITIRRFKNGVVQASYDVDIQNPLESLRTNIIQYNVRRDISGVDWMSFEIPVKQFHIAPTYNTLSASSIFDMDIPFNDQFYHLRAFYKNNTTGATWMEMKVTHSDQVFDPFVPTIVAQVMDGIVNVSLPHVYMMTGIVSGEIRLDVYTTRGIYNANMANYNLNSFEMNIRAIDEIRDLNPYTNVWSELSSFVFSDKFISGGSDAVDFQTLRNRVIFNSVGPQQIPITNAQVTTSYEIEGFELVKNVDVLTNRIFLALRDLPDPQNTKLLTPANIGISTWVANLDTVAQIEGIIDNIDRLTLLSNNVFAIHNDIVDIVPPSDVAIINQMETTEKVNLINNSRFVYNPYYYVLDRSGIEFSVRVYNLDSPSVENLSVLNQNPTLQLLVNTDTYNIQKTQTGFRIVTVTRSGTFYQEVPDSAVSVQLAFYPEGEMHLAYINGAQIGTNAENERIFEFIIETNHDINDKDQLCITNAKMFDNNPIQVWTALDKEFWILHASDSVTTNFVPDITDELIGKLFLPPGSVGNVRESIQVDFGEALKNLWTRSRILAAGLDYKRRETDMPKLYTADVYERDPVTGSIFTIDNGVLTYNKIHDQGEPMLDELGEPIYLWRAGDVEYDENGNPIVISPLDATHEIDLLFVDGKHFFANDPAYVDYRNEMRDTITTWIDRDIAESQKELLDQTRVYFHPVTTMSSIRVFTENDGEELIPSEQSFRVNLVVTEAVYKDSAVRTSIERDIVQVFDENIGLLEVNMTKINDELKERLGEGVISFQTFGLGGAKNLQVVRLTQNHHKLCLKKILSIQTDLSLIVKEDVVVEFNMMR